LQRGDTLSPYPGSEGVYVWRIVDSDLRHTNTCPLRLAFHSSNNQASVEFAHRSMTRAPVKRFAVHFEMASEVTRMPNQGKMLS
jgi:hypothetical protein